jgi:FMN phosphatase YigB (HAD superfamily)
MKIVDRLAPPPGAAGPAADSPVDPADDVRLAPVLRAIAAGEADVLSLDFFDTLSGRPVPEPVVAFRRVAEALVAAGIAPPALDAAAFVAVRAAAERRARARDPRRVEVSLSEIYAELPASMVPPARRAAARAVEVAVEAELAIVDPAVVALAQEAQRRGLRVAVVSDTYFSAADLLAILGRSGGWKPDVVLTSSDAGTGKCDRLFSRLAAAVGVAPPRMLHLGDNREADVLAAGRAGVRAFHFPRCDAELRRVVAREEGLSLATPGLDGGLAHVRARARWHVASVPEPLRGHHQLGASVLGPVFTAFADWAVELLAARGAQGAVCFMREGEFLADLLEAAARARGLPLAFRPLWISRRVAFVAGIGRLDAATIRAALVRRSPPTVAELCRSLEVEPHEVGIDEALAARLLVSERLIARVVERLLAPAARALVERRASEQRAMLLEHLAAAAPAGGPLVCVDLGWGATIQRNLHRALRVAGSERELVGVYLAATSRAGDVALEGSEVRGFLSGPGDHEALGELVARSPEVLEQLCTPAVGSLVRFERDGRGDAQPVLASVPWRGREPDERAAVRAGILRFQAQRAQLLAGRGGALELEHVRRILARLLARPTAGEAALLGGWRHDDNFGSAGACPIAPPVRRGRAAAQAYWDRSLYWPAASLARTDPRAADELAGYALLGLFADGRPEAHRSDAKPLRHRVVDRVEHELRAHAPLLHRAATWVAGRVDRAGAQEAPLRHRVVDALNARLKSLAPGLHAWSRHSARGKIDPS